MPYNIGLYLTHHIVNSRSALAGEDMSHIPTLAFINNLPPEVLTQIFCLVSKGQSCRVFRRLDSRYLAFELHYPQYPDVLMNVCTSWRDAIVACPSLWTHIDIALNHPINPTLLARAKTCVARAGKLPLNIHISDVASQKWTDIPGYRGINNTGLANSQELPPNSLTSGWARLDLCDFEFLNEYPNGTVPIRSLELDAVVFGDPKDCHLAAIAYIFANCLPGVFNEYTTRIRNEDYEHDYIRFIQSTDEILSPSGGLRLPLPAQFLEYHWLGTRILRVNGLCPPWTSRAYHGLIELDLGEGVPEIHQAQLVSMLRSSPRLGVLRLEVNTVGESRALAPVLLDDLEILSLVSSSWFSMGPSTSEAGPVPHLGNVLQFIATGSKPLQLSYFAFPGSPLVDFVGRSNVTRLFIRAWGGYDTVPIIRQCPVLQTLILSDCGINEKHEPNLGVPNCEEVSGRSIGGSTLVTRINTLYLAGFRQHCYEQLGGIVEKYSVHKLVIYGTDLWHEGKSPNSHPKEIESNLSTSTMCPIVQYFEGEDITFDPEDWD